MGGNKNVIKQLPTNQYCNNTFLDLIIAGIGLLSLSLKRQRRVDYFRYIVT